MALQQKGLGHVGPHVPERLGVGLGHAILHTQQSTDILHDLPFDITSQRQEAALEVYSCTCLSYR